MYIIRTVDRCYSLFLFFSLTFLRVTLILSVLSVRRAQLGWLLRKRADTVWALCTPSTA